MFIYKNKRGVFIFKKKEKKKKEKTNSRAFKFRLYPTKKQEEKLLWTLEQCRLTYNWALSELDKQEKPNMFSIQSQLPILKNNDEDLQNVYCMCSQNEVHQLFKNLKVLSKLKKKGIKVGKLKHKKFLKSFTYPSKDGHKITKTGNRCDKLYLSKIGNIKIRMHRKMDGKIKRVTIKKESEGWYAIFITDGCYKVDNGKLEKGFDYNVGHYNDSEGNIIDVPLFLNKSLKKIKKTNQELHRKKKGSKNRKKNQEKLNKQYAKIKRQKKNWAHNFTTKEVNNCSSIFIEDLNIEEMVKKTNKEKYFNMRNMLDSLWGLTAQMFDMKCQASDCKLVKVNPRNTTKTCHNCGYLQNMPLWKRVYNCSNCGLKIDRDWNSAINIKKAGKNTIWKEILAKQLGSVKVEDTKPIKQEAISF